MSAKSEGSMLKAEFIGPSVWHGREILACTRCKYLRTQLVKSGRNPAYDFFCMHPVCLASQLPLRSSEKLLKLVSEKLPDKLEYYKSKIALENAERTKSGEFISNDEVSPETPDWCPVVCAKKEVVA